MTDTNFQHFKSRILSAPIALNLEITSACNIQCRHCYNFWRDDSTLAPDRLSIEKIDELIDIIIRDQVYHVVLTGGEPFMNFKALMHALKRFSDGNVSTSVNSNLMLTSPDKMKSLKNVGLEHILTSLNSHDAATNDYMTNKDGNFKKIIEGIQDTIAAGIKVSVNMIVSSPNQDHVYQTAKLCAELGVNRIFGTRLVPAEYHSDPTDSDLNLNQGAALSAIDALLAAKNDFGIEVGTLVSYPLCLLGDLEKYKDFVGRGCPAQRGNRMVINANGESHACTHESTPYGDVFTEGIKGVFKKMKKWHDGSYLYKACADCQYINMCGSGCASAADAYYGNLNKKDPLWTGWDKITVPYKLEIPEEISQAIEDGHAFTVPKRVRFREEEGFYSINVRWANAYSINTELALFLKKMQKEQAPITLKNMVGGRRIKALTHLVYKEAIIPKDEAFRSYLEKNRKLGCSVDPEDVPDFQPLD